MNRSYIEKHREDIDNYYINLDFSFEDQERLYILIDFVTLLFMKQKDIFFDGNINLKTNQSGLKPYPKYNLAINEILYFIDLTLYLRTGKTLFENSETKYMFYVCDNGTVSIPLIPTEFLENTYEYFNKQLINDPSAKFKPIKDEINKIIKEYFDPIEIDTLNKTIDNFLSSNSPETLIESIRKDYGFSYFSRSKMLINSDNPSLFEQISDDERDNYACIEYGHSEVIWRYRKSSNIKNFLTSIGIEPEGIFLYKEIK